MRFTKSKPEPVWQTADLMKQGQEFWHTGSICKVVGRRTSGRMIFEHPDGTLDSFCDPAMSILKAETYPEKERRLDSLKKGDVFEVRGGNARRMMCADQEYIRMDGGLQVFYVGQDGAFNGSYQVTLLGNFDWSDES